MRRIRHIEHRLLIVHLHLPKISEKEAPIQNPNKDVCDIAILRESPQIIGYDGTVVNKFLAINSLVEMMTAEANMSTMSNNPSGPMIVAMGKFALLQTKLKPVLLAMSKSNDTKGKEQN